MVVSILICFVVVAVVGFTKAPPIPIPMSDIAALTLLVTVLTLVFVPTGAKCTPDGDVIGSTLSLSLTPIGTPISVLTGIRVILGVGISPVEGAKWTSDGSGVGENERLRDSGRNRSF